SQSSYVFPVAIVFVSKKSLPLFSAVRENMLSKITAGLVLQSDQRFFQHWPAKNINTHRSQITFGLLRFFLKVCNPSCLVRDSKSETGSFFPWNRHTCQGDICFVGFMEIQHNFIIHLVNMVSSQDQHIIRVKILHICQILVNGVCSTGIPFCIGFLFVRRKNRNASYISVQIPWDADTDMSI